MKYEYKDLQYFGQSELIELVLKLQNKLEKQRNIERNSINPFSIVTHIDGKKIKR